MHPWQAEHVLITGGTGFIGSALAQRLLHLGARVTVLTRNPAHARKQFSDRVTAIDTLKKLGDEPSVIVNLAGKNLGEERWNERVKQDLIASRVETTHAVIDYIAQTPNKPRLLISGSAVGYYGARGDETLREDDPPGHEFQSLLCRQWEEAALQAEQYGVRVCLSRAGVVLGRGGALSGLAPMFRKGLGAVAGSGEQWVSWIHMDDLLNLFLRFVQDDTLSGAFNNTSPNPVTNRELSHAIGRALNRPVLFRAPAWAMYGMFGEMARLYLTGQKVIPARHMDMEVRYQFDDIEAAVRDALI